MAKEKVAVAMSGGIDSSTVVASLLEQGYECFGVHMNLWRDKEDKKKEKALKDAEKIAKQLGIDFHVIDLKKSFKEIVVDYYLEAYTKGETPNPCVVCNPTIKFGEFLNKSLKLGAKYMATGHYARIKKRAGKYQLHAGSDPRKDQSYFLYKLSQKQLSKIRFPLGEQDKVATRKMAKQFGLKVVENKEESQGICFVPDKSYGDFLKRNLPKKYFKEGLIKDLEGNKLGRHRGLPFYTLGQRKGIRIGGPGGPYYVVRIDQEANEVIVGKDSDLWHKQIYARDLHFISGETPKKPFKTHARIRHLGKLEPATVEIKRGIATITFPKPVRAFTEGQSIVFYKGTQVLGGGVMVIEK